MIPDRPRVVHVVTYGLDEYSLAVGMSVNTLRVQAPDSPNNPSDAPDCVDDDRLCRWAWELTGHDWLAEASTFALAPLRIIGILLLALIVRWLAVRVVNRFVRRAANGGQSAQALRPLPERLRNTVQEATALVSPERREQRAEAIGSVLRSTISITVFTVAVLLALGELGIHLGPLLAGAGIAGVALGFGAQALVRDVISGLFMLLEDQYGVGDIIDMGDAIGTVVAVGIRITTLRDLSGVYWYIPNGEVQRVGNYSQGVATVVVDMPVGYAPVPDAVAALRRGAEQLAEDPEVSGDLLGAPEILGVHQVTVEGSVVRTTVEATPHAQWQVGREMRRRQAEALKEAGLADQVRAGWLYPHRPEEEA